MRSVFIGRIDCTELVRMFPLSAPGLRTRRPDLFDIPQGSGRVDFVCLSCLTPSLAATLSLIYSFRHALLGQTSRRLLVIRALIYVRDRYHKPLPHHAIIHCHHLTYNLLLRICLLKVFLPVFIVLIFFNILCLLSVLGQILFQASLHFTLLSSFTRFIAMRLFICIFTVSFCWRVYQTCMLFTACMLLCFFSDYILCVVIVCVCVCT